MTKLDFLLSLNKQLSPLPQEEVKERLSFYCEMIEDRIEEGLSEEDAVSAIGSIEEIAEQIQNDIGNISKEARPDKSNRKLKAWELMLLVLGSPIWLSLLIAAFAVVLCLYSSLWAIIISVWAVFGSLIACAFGAMMGGIGFCFAGKIPSGVVLIAASFICAGLGIFLFFGCKFLTNSTVVLTKKVFLICKNRSQGKEAAL